MKKDLKVLLGLFVLILGVVGGGNKATAANLPDSSIKYRALIIGETAYPTRLEGPDNDMNFMSGMLESLDNKYEVVAQENCTREEVVDLIDFTFGDATDSDISLFYYSGHGLVNAGEAYSGALRLIGEEFITTADLAEILGAVPGKVIVILDSCGSGAAISDGDEEELIMSRALESSLFKSKASEEKLSLGDESLEDSFDPDAFNENVINEFSSRDSVIRSTAKKGGRPLLRSAELRQTKFYVITGSAYEELSKTIQRDGVWGGLLTRAIADGLGYDFPEAIYKGEMPADINDDFAVTFSELADHCKEYTQGEQHVLSYSASPALKLFYHVPVGEAPDISDSVLPSGEVGEAYNQMLEAEGTQTITWTVTDGSLPEGLTLDSATGIVSGNPTSSGEYSFTITVSNYWGTASGSFTISIEEAAEPENNEEVSEKPDEEVSEKTNEEVNEKVNEKVDEEVSEENNEAVNEEENKEVNEEPQKINEDVNEEVNEEITEEKEEKEEKEEEKEEIHEENVEIPNEVGLVEVKSEVISKVTDETREETFIEQHDADDYVWILDKKATESDDGEIILKCRECGLIHAKIPVSSYGVFNTNTVTKIKNAEPGATINITTNRWNSCHFMILKALSERPDVKLKISFLEGGHKGIRRCIVIPGGPDVLELLNGTNFAGFMYIGKVLGFQAS